MFPAGIYKSVLDTGWKHAGMTRTKLILDSLGTPPYSERP